jgi:hypothetical protein
MFTDVQYVPGMLVNKTVDGCRVRALFTQVDDWNYEVVLDVSSQKFLLRFSDTWWSIDRFEVLSVRWFIYDLTLNLITSLKTIVEKVLY